jgi:hypothetical protein
MKNLAFNLSMLLGFVVVCALSLVVIVTGAVIVSCLAGILSIGEKLSFAEQRKIAKKAGNLSFGENDDSGIEHVKERM